MFLLLEDGGVILMDNIVALIRHEGATVITRRDNSALESAFAPATLDRRSSRLISRQNKMRKNIIKSGTAADLTRRAEKTRTEDN